MLGSEKKIVICLGGDYKISHGELTWQNEVYTNLLLK